MLLGDWQTDSLGGRNHTCSPLPTHTSEEVLLLLLWTGQGYLWPTAAPSWPHTPYPKVCKLQILEPTNCSKSLGVYEKLYKSE